MIILHLKYSRIEDEPGFRLAYRLLRIYCFGLFVSHFNYTFYTINNSSYTCLCRNLSSYPEIWINVMVIIHNRHISFYIRKNNYFGYGFVLSRLTIKVNFWASLLCCRCIIILKILYLLQEEGQLCPCDLSDILGMNTSPISQHLRKLKDSKIHNANA